MPMMRAPCRVTSFAGTEPTILLNLLADVSESSYHENDPGDDCTGRFTGCDSICCSDDCCDGAF